MGKRAGRRQEGAYRQDRQRKLEQQPVRSVDRECDHLLQLRHPVAAAHEVRGERKRESRGADQEDVAGGVAPYPPERPLHLPRRRDMSSTWMPSRRGCTWVDGIFPGSRLHPPHSLLDPPATTLL